MYKCNCSQCASPLIPQHVAETCACIQIRFMFEEGGRQESDEGTFTFSSLSTLVGNIVVVVHPLSPPSRDLFLRRRFLCIVRLKRTSVQIGGCARAVHFEELLVRMKIFKWKKSKQAENYRTVKFSFAIIFINY